MSNLIQYFRNCCINAHIAHAKNTLADHEEADDAPAMPNPGMDDMM